MILLTRLNGPTFALNPDLVERADCTPDTVITLVDGTKYVVAESLPDFVALVRHYRASVVAEAQQLSGGRPVGASSGPTSAGGMEHGDRTASPAPGDNVVRLHRRER